MEWRSQEMLRHLISEDGGDVAVRRDLAFKWCDHESDQGVNERNLIAPTPQEEGKESEVCGFCSGEPVPQRARRSCLVPSIRRPWDMEQRNTIAAFHFFACLVFPLWDADRPLDPFPLYFRRYHTHTYGCHFARAGGEWIGVAVGAQVVGSGVHVSCQAHQTWLESFSQLSEISAITFRSILQHHHHVQKHLIDFQKIGKIKPGKEDVSPCPPCRRLPYP